MKRIFGVICALLLCGAMSFAQDTQSTTTTTTTTPSTEHAKTRHKKHVARHAANSNADQSKSDMQSAGSDTKGAAKSFGHGVKHGAKAVGNKTKEGYEASKDKVDGNDKTTTTTTTDTTNPHMQQIAFQSSDAAASNGKLDLNSASADDLDKLPGIGPATAKKIIDGRPYTAKNQLVNKGILSQKQYDAVKDQIVAHRATSKKAKSAAGSTKS